MSGCGHFEEVRSALAAGHWPDGVAPELREHAAGCQRCTQTILLATQFQRARGEAMAVAQPGSSSLLWWRAQLRRRNAALEQASRPIAAAQIFAFAIVLVALAAVVIAHWTGILQSSATAIEQGFAFGDWGLPAVLIAIALITTLGGVAVYLSTDRR